MSLQEFLEFQARPFGGWGGSSDLSLAMQLTQLRCLSQIQGKQLNSGVWPNLGGVYTWEGSSVSKHFVFRLGRRGFPGKAEKEHLPGL